MPMDFLKQLGRVVYARRTAQRLSLEELGHRAGVHRAYISEIERGARNPSLTILKKLATALDTNIALLAAEAEGLVVSESRAAAEAITTDFSPVEDGRTDSLQSVVTKLQERVTEQDKIIDAIPALIWLKDADNTIIRANLHAARNLGLGKDEVEGRSTYDLYPALAGKYHNDDLEVVKTRRPKLGIVELHTPNLREPRWVRTDKFPFVSENGQVHVLVVSLDITDLLLTHAALMETQKL